MIQLQWLQALLLILGLIASSVVVIASFIKTSREQRRQDNENWKLAVDALKEHNNALKERLADEGLIQVEQGKTIAVLEGSVQSMEKERASWTRRNMALFDHCQDLRARLIRLNQDPGETPNGGREG
jgi:hypothetical protein